MILTNLHMVDIPYARKVSCARESKVIEVTHTLLHLSLAHMDELDSRACICASFLLLNNSKLSTSNCKFQI